MLHYGTACPWLVIGTPLATTHDTMNPAHPTVPQIRDDKVIWISLIVDIIVNHNVSMSPYTQLDYVNQVLPSNTNNAEDDTCLRKPKKKMARSHVTETG